MTTGINPNDWVRPLYFCPTHQGVEIIFEPGTDRELLTHMARVIIGWDSAYSARVEDSPEGKYMQISVYAGQMLSTEKLMYIAQTMQPHFVAVADLLTGKVMRRNRVYLATVVTVTLGLRLPWFIPSKGEIEAGDHALLARTNSRNDSGHVTFSLAVPLNKATEPARKILGRASIYVPPDVSVEGSDPDEDWDLVPEVRNDPDSVYTKWAQAQATPAPARPGHFRR